MDGDLQKERASEWKDPSEQSKDLESLYFMATLSRAFAFVCEPFVCTKRWDGVSWSWSGRGRCRWAHWIRIRWGIKWLTTDSFACFTYFLVFYLCFSHTRWKHGVHIVFVFCALFRSLLVLSLEYFRIFHSFCVKYGVRSTLLFDIPCKYWNWLNTLQNDKRMQKKKKTRNQHQQWRRQ